VGLLLSALPVEDVDRQLWSPQHSAQQQLRAASRSQLTDEAERRRQNRCLDSTSRRKRCQNKSAFGFTRQATPTVEVLRGRARLLV